MTIYLCCKNNFFLVLRSLRDRIPSIPLNLLETDGLTVLLILAERWRVIDPTVSFRNLFGRVEVLEIDKLALACTVDDACIGAVPQNWLKYAIVRQ